ncbi:MULTISPECIES: IS3 family transposase [unclassified Wolbachia]|uniref:IS3 family transposase n=1 Tax=unclassified Wolbachia TaxID=2640676 RepID=UPI003132A446
MSNKGCCYDNSVAESFFSSLKREILIDTSQHSAQQTRTAIFEYIEIFITNNVTIRGCPQTSKSSIFPT